ncbi:EpsG family protein [Deefgea piscis]|uniref:EpsG family protein n=1 Tax=Deefgea piscis TaxID=2739061 RepID=UPI0021038FEE|nr:EpsG family protein [Deefgea piscis]
MYFIIVSVFLFLFASLNRRNISYRVFFIFPVLVLPVIVLNIYFQGEDWVNYRNFAMSGAVLSTPELAFNFLFKALYYFSGSLYPLAVYLYYVIAFLLIYYFFCFYGNGFFELKTRYFIFFVSGLFFIFGPTLVAEQLRQFLALIIVLFASSKCVKRQWLHCLALVLLASFFHISAIVFISVFFCCSFFNKKRYFIVSSIFLSIGLYFSVVSVALLSSGFVADKVETYLKAYSFGFGIRHLICLFYIVTYVSCIDERKLERPYLFLNRISFFGAVLMLTAVYLPFLDRYAGYFLVFMFLNVLYGVCYKKSAYVLNFISIVLFLVFTFGYYRNSIAPFDFFVFRNEINSLFFGDIDFDRRAFDIQDNQLYLMKERGMLEVRSDM